jgi:hypothetical protein
MAEAPETDIRGMPFTKRDQKLLSILLRPEGGTLDGLNRAVAVRVAARSYIRDSTRLAERLGGRVWYSGHGGTRRFGIRF